MTETTKAVNLNIQGDVIVVGVDSGEFVLEQAQSVGNLVFNRYDVGYDKIVLDLSKVIYINSSGISMIIRLNLERKFKLVGISKGVRDILDLTGILPFVSEYESVQSAIEDFKR